MVFIAQLQNWYASAVGACEEKVWVEDIEGHVLEDAHRDVEIM